MNLNRFLESCYDTPDNRSVTLTISTNLGELRRNITELGKLKITDAQKADAAEGKSAKQASAKRAKSRQGKAAKASKAGAAKKTTASKKSTKANGRTRSANAVSRDAVIDAIRAGHGNGPAIANAINADVAQVHKALSRYVKSGHVVRVGTGQYALP